MAPSDANIYYYTPSTDGNTMSLLTVMVVSTMLRAAHYVSLYFGGRGVQCKRGGVLWSEKLTGSRKGDLRRR